MAQDGPNAALVELSHSVLVEGLAGLAEGDVEGLVDVDDALLLHVGEYDSGLDVLSRCFLGLAEILLELVELGQLQRDVCLLLLNGKIISRLLLGRSAPLLPAKIKVMGSRYNELKEEYEDYLHLEHGMRRALVERDAGGAVEDGGDLLVHLNVLVGFDGDPFTARDDLRLHPLLKVPTGQRGQDVHDPLLWKAGPLLLLIGEEGLKILVPIDVRVDLLETEALVLGHIAVLDLVLLDVLLLAAEQVLEEVYKRDQRRARELTNGDMLITREVGLHLGLAEEVDLVLRLGLGGPGAGEHLDLLLWSFLDLVVALHAI